MKRKEFELQAEKLCALLGEWKKSQSKPAFALADWKVRGGSDGGEIYLIHPPVWRVVKAEPYIVDEVQPCHKEESTELHYDDEAVEPALIAKWETRLSFQISVTYSETYEVPVLYLRAEHTCGSPCSRTELLSVLTGDQDTGSSSSMWEFISQEQHPVTGGPWYFLHPCRSHSILKTLTDADSPSDLWVWMTLMMPAVGFSVPSSVFLLIQNGFL